MSELRKECYKCLNNQKCLSAVDYGSIYCQFNRKFEMPSKILTGGGRANGKTIEVALELYNKVNDLPKGEVRGIINNGKGIILITKDELLAVSKKTIKDRVKEIKKLIEDEQFKVIMGDTTVCNRIKYILDKEILGDK